MHRITRPLLDGATEDYLDRLQREVNSAASPKIKAANLWSSKNSDRFRAIRTALRKMATGRSRCMYCEDSLGTDIDHFRPKKTFPDYSFQWINYLLACSHCNSNEKREKFPLDEHGSGLLIDPTVDDPLTHLALLPHLGEFAARSNRGSASIEVFGLNRDELTQGRIDSWVALDALIRRYADAIHSGEMEDAGLIRDTIHNAAFKTVADVMQSYAFAQINLLPADLRGLIREFPELLIRR